MIIALVIVGGIAIFAFGVLAVAINALDPADIESRPHVDLHQE